MSFYIGTKTSCEAYNEEVTQGMGLGHGDTITWSLITRHATQSKFAVVAHHEFVAENLKLVERLTEDWFPDELL